MFAWLSLIWVGFSDVYDRLVSMGVITFGVVSMGLINACIVGMGILIAGVKIMGIS